MKNLELYNNIRSAVKTGRYFTAYFKKSDGSLRVMKCRTGVKAGLVPDSERKAKAAKGNVEILKVWDTEKLAYRSINLNRLFALKVDGRYYKMSSINEHNVKADSIVMPTRVGSIISKGYSYKEFFLCVSIDKMNDTAWLLSLSDSSGRFGGTDHNGYEELYPFSTSSFEQTFC